MNNEIEKITDEYGQLHELNCALNDEGGSFDGCDCAMKSLVKELVEWRCENCDSKYAEYVNGCPRCATGKVGGSYSVYPVDVEKYKLK